MLFVRVLSLLRDRGVYAYTHARLGGKYEIQVSAPPHIFCRMTFGARDSIGGTDVCLVLGVGD